MPNISTHFTILENYKATMKIINFFAFIGAINCRLYVSYFIVVTIN